jgi:4-hydroxy-3-polyprenylbenzoate decarboxylase
MYRMQVYSNTETGMHFHKQKDGQKHLDWQKLKGEKLEVAVALGCDPAVIYAATAPLPPDVDEMILAGFIRGKSVPMVKGKFTDILVPAEAEIVIEGYIDPEERRIEGPFGDHTGFYSLADDYPVFHVRGITMRRGAIYPTTIVGPPPMEDCFLGKMTERLFLPAMKKIVPEIVDIDMPIEGIFHNFVIVSIDKTYPGQARKVMMALWGMGQMMFAKCILVVDKEVDVHNYREVFWHALNCIDPGRDTMVVEGPVDCLEHASPLPNFGTKIGIDGTKKLPGEGHNREWPDRLVMDNDAKQKAISLMKKFKLME